MAEIIQFQDENEFIEYNRDFLETNYLSHYHLIGILERLDAGQFEVHHAFNVEDGRGCSLICLWITGHLFIYSNEWNEEIIECFQKHVPLTEFKNFQFMGQRALILDLLTRNNLSYEIMKDRLIYECTKTNDLELSPGVMTEAEMDNLEQLGEMSYNYHLDEYKGNGGRDREYMTAVAKHGIEHGSLFNWVDKEEICSIAQIVNRDKPVSMIGLLFTKNEKRNTGYARSLLHSLTNRQFKNGVEKCGLVADIHNLSSNKVFVNVGYRPIYETILCFVGATEIDEG